MLIMIFLYLFNQMFQVVLDLNKIILPAVQYTKQEPQYSLQSILVDTQQTAILAQLSENSEGYRELQEQGQKVNEGQSGTVFILF